MIGIVSPISSQIRNANEFLKSKQSYSVADAQAENALYRLNKGRSDAPTTLSLLGATASAVLTDVGALKQISVNGVLDQFQRNIQAQFQQDTGTAFNYGLQTGVGGIYLDGTSYIDGNVYANGNIMGDGGPGWANTYITGSAIVANSSYPVPTVINTVSTTTDSFFAIGQNNDNQDFAQSFVYSTSSPISGVKLYLKRTTALPNSATIKIVNNSSGQPGSTVLASGTLNASLATSLFSYVPVAMTTTTSFVSGTTYWLVIDNPSNSTSNYFTIGTNDSLYSGNTKIGRFHNSSWTNTATTSADIKFEIESGGNYGRISGMRIGTSGTGTAWAHSVDDTIVTGTLYCQDGLDNNKACDTSRADPAPSDLPISQGNIDEWKADATAGGSTSTIIIDGNNSKTLGPIKINGNLTVQSSGKLYITGPIYVTGTLIVEGSGKIYVDSSMGTVSGLILADGTIDLRSSGGIYGSGSAGSYVVVVTTSTCGGGGACTNPALEVTGSAGSVVVAAPYGTVKFEGSVSVKSVVAKTMYMEGSSHIVYDSGLTNLDFTSGPSGAWTISSWREVEE